MDLVSKIFKVKAPVQAASKLKSVECANPHLIAGVELETENGHFDEYFYRDRLDSSIWIIERDGSLRGDGAYEFISKPLPMQNLIPELYRYFETTGFSSKNYTDRCSVHVHTNVTNFTQDNLAALALVYSVVEEVLFEFVNHFNVKEKDGMYRDTNIYCVPWNQCRLNHHLIDRLFNKNTNPFHAWQKYTALNLLPITTQGTVEWRHMHGTADMEKLTTWLNIIGSIMKYAKEISFEETLDIIKKLNDTSAYQQFFEKIFQKYLGYTEAYRKHLFEGVIMAKYSLLNGKQVVNTGEGGVIIGQRPIAAAQLRREPRYAEVPIPIGAPLNLQTQIDWDLTDAERVRQREVRIRMLQRQQAALLAQEAGEVNVYQDDE